MDRSTTDQPSRRRSTRQKRALAAALDASEEFQSAQDLYTRLRAHGQSVGLATVYNQLRTLAESGRIDAVRSNDGEILYRRCHTEEHHHHLLCRHCGRTVEVEAPEVERWAKAVAASHRYEEINHTLEVVGTCPDCSTNCHEC
jgi:Fur family ferric uptake transcriptional regulator